MTYSDLDIDAIRERHRTLNDEALRRIAASDDDGYAASVRRLAREELAERGIVMPATPAAPQPRAATKHASAAPAGMEKAKWIGYIGISMVFFSLLMLGGTLGLATRTKLGYFFDCLWSFYPACSVSYTHATSLHQESGRLFAIGGLAFALHLAVGLGFHLSLRKLMVWWGVLVALCAINLVSLFT
ncbi:hypothetical protein OK348_13135 [Flavobacterium sp. MXW15]|uniref:DUF1707 domain-containing protein n=1 Tax=Xanthomonas chitinilytica TaxID=2989819 RepID=A0ABT3JWX9_9XANT|nr:hypothetical protein [Xanthomonas sp. H13-6]MCW4455729.1 hypothetical protein [Flavobacterium sp. MXW15]MCW4472945.1 hypothetical protein [Xanthomonas sp. H13-6]